mmetsp:Transcript_12650/g.54172  ORF Transcript_12650/g.54172 Transcript_12650/m.54172 type:complete len:367 (-) Transcript_12650:1020-2120(-)
MMSSTVSFATKNCTFTAFRCPILCARSSACTISPGVHVSSPKTTTDAAVNVKPIPAALMDKTATRAFGSVWKRSTKLCRLFGSVEPSMRMKGVFFLRSISEAASSMQEWWPKKRNFSHESEFDPNPESPNGVPELSRSVSRYSAAAFPFAKAVAWYNSFISRFSSRVRPPPLKPPLKPLSSHRKASRSSSILVLIARTLLSAAECGSVNTIFSRLFAGSCVRTSFLSRRIMISRDSTACSSSPLLLPCHPNRDPAQYRVANSPNLVNTIGRSASACEKISTGRDSAGVPVRHNALLAPFKSGTTAFVLCALESFKKCDSSHTTTWNRFESSVGASFPTSEYGTIANVAPSIFRDSAPLPTAATVSF